MACDMIVLLITLLLSLHPRNGQSCECDGSDFTRFTTMRKGVCSNQVYSGVVVGATCSCRAADDAIDCRQYSYDEEDASYSSRVLSRVELLDAIDPFYENYLSTCMKAENDLSPGVRIPLENGSEPDVVMKSATNVFDMLPCPFNDRNNSEHIYESEPVVCLYSIRVTEVFIGSVRVGDLIMTTEPDNLINGYCGRGIDIYDLLQLNTEYLLGLCCVCELEPLSAYSEEDLRFLRDIAETVRGGDDLLYVEVAICASDSVHVASTAALLAALISVMTFFKCIS